MKKLFVPHIAILNGKYCIRKFDWTMLRFVILAHYPHDNTFSWWALSFLKHDSSAYKKRIIDLMVVEDIPDLSARWLDYKLYMRKLKKDKRHVKAFPLKSYLP